MKKIVKKYKKIILPPYSKKDMSAFLFTLLGVFGFFLVFSVIHADIANKSRADSINTLEPENGTLTGDVHVINDQTASGGKYVEFGSRANTTISIPDTNYTFPQNALFLSPNGNDANAGSIDAPLKTIAKAISVASNGATVVFRAGVYRDGMTLSTPKSISWQAYPHEQVWLDGADIVSGWQSTGNGVWYVDNWNTPAFCAGQYYLYAYNAQKADNSGPCNHIDMASDPSNPMAGSPQMAFVDSIAVKEVGSLAQVNGNTFFYDKSAKRFYLGVDPTNHTIELTARPTAFLFEGGSGNFSVRGLGFRHFGSNEFNGNKTQAAVLANEPGITFEKDVFTQSAGAGLAVVNPINSIVTDSIFYQNGFNGLDANGHRVDSGITDNMLVQNNTFDGNNTELFGTGCTLSCAAAGSKMAHMVGVTLKNNIFQNNQGAGYWCDLDCSGAIVVDNVFRDNTGNGLYYEVSQNGILASNIILNNGGYGIKNGSANVKIYNNTLVNNTKSVLIYDDNRVPSGSDVGPNTTNVEFNNNVIAQNSPVLSWKGQNGAEVLYKDFDYNSYYRSNPQTTTLFEWQASTGTTNFVGVNDFHNATNWEKNGQDVTSGADPFFVNSASGDYRISPTSNAYGSGKQLPSDVASAIGVSIPAPVNRGALAWPGRLAQ